MKDFWIYYTSFFNDSVLDGLHVRADDFQDVLDEYFSGYVYKEVTSDDNYDVVIRSKDTIKYYWFRFG